MHKRPVLFHIIEDKLPHQLHGVGKKLFDGLNHIASIDIFAVFPRPIVKALGTGQQISLHAVKEQFLECLSSLAVADAHAQRIAVLSNRICQEVDRVFMGLGVVMVMFLVVLMYMLLVIRSHIRKHNSITIAKELWSKVSDFHRLPDEDYAFAELNHAPHAPVNDGRQILGRHRKVNNHYLGRRALRAVYTGNNTTHGAQYEWHKAVFGLVAVITGQKLAPAVCGILRVGRDM